MSDYILGWVFFFMFFFLLFSISEIKVCCFILSNSPRLLFLVDKTVFLCLKCNWRLHGYIILYSLSTLWCQNTFISAWKAFHLGLINIALVLLTVESLVGCQIKLRERFLKIWWSWTNWEIINYFKDLT